VTDKRRDDVQTFVPDTTIPAIAEVLDSKRLFKQAVEAKQIYLALTTPGYGWQNHPAVKMWRGAEGALLRYGSVIVSEHLRRGYSAPVLGPWYDSMLDAVPDTPMPHWWGDQRVHSSHRAALYRKNPDHYAQWANETATEYWWPQERQ
jgi:hypothetical protein